MPNVSTCCLCAVSSGKSTLSLADFLAARLQREQHQPLLLSCEPVNGPRRLPNFSGLTTPGGYEGMQPLLLTEARLFYPSGLLHLLAGPGETRWAAWWETKPDQESPVWCPSSTVGVVEAEMLRKGRTILLTMAAGMRGLSGADAVGEAVTAIEYYEQGILRWWRLEPYAQR
jgi:hypothetical protein